MTIKVGDQLPQGSFRVMTADGPAVKTTDDIFPGKTVVLFAVPGAFTPTCHKNHLPGFLAKAGEFKAKGVDTIAVVAANDVFVMNAWAKDTGAGDAILFLADGNADFARALELSLDGSGFGLGTRFQRFAMLVKDGVVQVLNVEDAPGKADISGAEKLLADMPA
jgi:peroxiredoxin